MDDLPIPETWTPSERWAWEQMAAGRPADFSAEPTKDPLLSPGFLDTVFKDPYVSRLPKAGVRIKGVRVPGANIHVAGPLPGGLSIATSHIEEGIFLFGTRISGGFELDTVDVGKFIWLQRADVTESILLKEVTVGLDLLLHQTKVGGDIFVFPSLDKLTAPKKERGGSIGKWFSCDEAIVGGSISLMRFDAETVSLEGAKIGGSLDTFDLKVSDRVRLDRIDVARGVHVNNIQCGYVSADEATIGRDFSLSGVAAGLGMSRAHILGHFLLSGEVKSLTLERTAVDSDAVLRNLTIRTDNVAGLQRMRIGGSLTFEKVECLGSLSLDECRIEGDLSLGRGSNIHQSVRAALIQVGGGAKLGGATLNGATFAGADIKGDFSLVSDFDGLTQWVESSELDLHNAEVGAISDQPFLKRGAHQDPWPAKLDLRGFKFRKLAAYGGSGEDRSALSPNTLKAWLARDTSGTMQPYVQFAKALQEAGEQSKANSMLYAGRERTRVEAQKRGAFGPWLGLSLLKWTIGYGLGTRYFRALLWVGAFVGVGVLTLHLDQTLSGHRLTPQSGSVLWMSFASLDALLPIVSLDKSFSDKVPAELCFMVSRTVFWILGIAGWILGSFLVAGFAGLTQRESGS